MLEKLTVQLVESPRRRTTVHTDVDTAQAQTYMPHVLFHYWLPRGECICIAVTATVAANRMCITWYGYTRSAASGQRQFFIHSRTNHITLVMTHTGKNIRLPETKLCYIKFESETQWLPPKQYHMLPRRYQLKPIGHKPMVMRRCCFA